VILGPTASGKTSLAIKLAKAFAGEIVSADSRQLYRELDIGTAKPVKPAVVHHLINVIKPNRKFSVALYKKLALKAIGRLYRQKKLPFLVGGTGLYLKAVTDNIDYPQASPQVNLRKMLEKKSPAELFQIYRQLDPFGAQKIDQQNTRRLIRAIEVCRATNKPFWSQRKQGSPLFKTLKLGLRLSDRRLVKNIAQRTKVMIRQGLEKEARQLFKKYGRNCPALQTIGYQEWLPYWEGKTGKEAVEKTICLHTRQYAKRQLTWFKKDKKIVWVKDYPQAAKTTEKFLAG
jgi:tRNA dimethylallyltransferase